MTEEEIKALIKYYASRLSEVLSSFDNDVVIHDFCTEIVEERWNKVRSIYDNWRKWKEKLEENDRSTSR